jgi:hypothetical protein
MRTLIIDERNRKIKTKRDETRKHRNVIWLQKKTNKKCYSQRAIKRELMWCIEKKTAEDNRKKEGKRRNLNTWVLCLVKAKKQLFLVDKGSI